MGKVHSLQHGKAELENFFKVSDEYNCYLFDLSLKE